MRASTGKRIIVALTAAASLSVGVNSVLYAAKRANPFLGADWWYYVKSFLIAQEAEGLTMASLLAKRFSLDHALPLQKLLLLRSLRSKRRLRKFRCAKRVASSSVKCAKRWRAS